MSAFLIAGVMLVALVVYVLTGGADFGGGVWDLFATGVRKDAQRKLIERAIAPIWEANHVWLILIIVLLFSGFPKAFSSISIALHVPLTVVLLGIVFRGAAFVFRQYGEGDNFTNRRWGNVFAVSSLITPMFLGITLGTLSSNTLVLHEDVPQGGFLWPWMLNPLSAVVGVLTVSICAFLAAVYLTVEAASEELRSDFRVRAFVSFGAVSLALAAALVVGDDVTQLRARLLGQSIGIVCAGIVAVSGLAVVHALYVRAFARARVFAMLFAAFIVVGWGVSQYPYVIVSRVEPLTFHAAQAPEITQRLLLIVLGTGSLLLLPSLYIMFRIFKGQAGDQKKAPRSRESAGPVDSQKQA